MTNSKDNLAKMRESLPLIIKDQVSSLIEDLADQLENIKRFDKYVNVEQSVFKVNKIVKILEENAKLIDNILAIQEERNEILAARFQNLKDLEVRADDLELLPSEELSESDESF